MKSIDDEHLNGTDNMEESQEFRAEEWGSFVNCTTRTGCLSKCNSKRQGHALRANNKDFCCILKLISWK